MAFIAQSILIAPARPAPKEYESIDVIAQNKPKGEYEELALLQIDKSTVVAWHIRDKGTWKLASGYYVISKEKIKHQRGARYTKEKEVFVKKYWEDLIACNITRNLKWSHPDCIRLIRLAQDEVGYSPVTAMCDVWHAIGSEFMKQYKGKKVVR